MTVEDRGVPGASGRSLLPLVSTRRTAPVGFANACYFRSGPQLGRRKALVQITERCDLRCAHCFVSATKAGEDMPLARLTHAVMKQFVQARVANVTLTGGEPFVHPDLLHIVARFIEYDIDVTICSNAVSISQDAVAQLASMERVQVNVSLDGLTAESHGRFRGKRDSFPATMRNTHLLADAGLLKGILTTPNKLAAPGEYQRLNELARELQVQYLLMNPLSGFGRGYLSRRHLEAGRDAMKALEAELTRLEQQAGDHELVLVRFPNEAQPLSGCIAGDVFYVFVDGEITVCPYLAFATMNPGAQHSREEFAAGNLFSRNDLAQQLDDYDIAQRYRLGDNSTCQTCSMTSTCGKGCPAAVIANGGRIGDVDAEVCPVVSHHAP